MFLTCFSWTAATLVPHVPSHPNVFVDNQSLTLVLQRTMAPNLAKSTLEFIHDMISSGELTASQIAEAAGCSKRAITRIRSNMRLFGSIKAPSIKAGRPRSITPIMLEALCTVYLRSRLYTFIRWKFSCWMNSTYPYQSPRSAIPCIAKGGQRRQLDKRQKSETRIYVMTLSSNLRVLLVPPDLCG